MRVFFAENRSFLEDPNDQVPRASETPWFWVFLAFLTGQVKGSLFFLSESTMSIFLNGLDMLLQLLEPPRDSCCQSSFNSITVNESVSRIPLS